MARGDVLQIVAFSVLFAMAVSAVGEKGKPIVAVAESLMQVMFKFTNYVMMFAPIGVGAAMAHTIGTQGLGVLLNLGNLILSLYVALVILIVLVFGGIILLLRIPLRQFVRAVREPATLAFATTSSESALPKAMESMERFGVPPHIVGLVMPTGYSFNLDRLDALPGDGFSFRRAGRGDDDRPSRWTRATANDDARAHDHFEGRGRGAAFFARHPARDPEQFPAGRTRPDRCRGHLRR